MLDIQKIREDFPVNLQNRARSGQYRGRFYAYADAKLPIFTFFWSIGEVSPSILCLFQC